MYAEDSDWPFKRIGYYIKSSNRWITLYDVTMDDIVCIDQQFEGQLIEKMFRPAC